MEYDLDGFVVCMFLVRLRNLCVYYFCLDVWGYLWLRGYFWYILKVVWSVVKCGLVWGWGIFSWGLGWGFLVEV